ncbi:MAG TPA: type II toxin-antitoxin system RelE/ParE family toxin [Proteobacteria bacterium]|nr:type II toxin-antitoxin system RelE/ParE family toxin [Pseudomonadota bacterium]
MDRNPAFQVNWARTAVIDLEAIVEYIAHDDITTALSILKKLERAAEGMTTIPLRGRIVPEIASYGIRIYRELISSPWRIIYRISGKSVSVVSVLDSRRNLEDILFERLIRGITTDR